MIRLLFINDQIEMEDQTLHKLIDEIINMVELCQIIQRMREPDELRRYFDLLYDVSYAIIKLYGDFQQKQN